MTTKNTNSESGKFEHVKQLNAINQQGSDVISLINNVKDLRRKLDAVILQQRERERNAERAKREELRRLEEALRATREEKPKEPSLIAQELEQAKNNPAASTAVEAFSEQNNVESSKVENEPVLTRTTSEKESQKTDKENSSDKLRTKQFDSTPSYIRGHYTPAPPPVPQAKPPMQYNRELKRPNQGAPRQGMQNGQRPYNNNNTRDGGFNRNTNSPRPNAGQSSFGQNRPAGAGGMFGGNKKPISLPKIDLPTVPQRKSLDKKKDQKTTEEKKAMSKRTLIRKGFIQENLDDDRANVRRLKNKKNREQVTFVAPKVEKAVITTENLTVKILSEKIGKTAQEIIKQLMLLNIFTNINSVVDFPTMELVANELGVELELKIEQTKEEILEADHDDADDEKDLVKRPPIITVMGHVDHGKTSLLDAVRKTSVVSGEAGGITQHIGSYSVVCKGEKITFLDTPGHEAFVEMRARGAKVTDIAVLVVAADDGIMPQTIEAINHAKLAKVPIIVAINKIDKPQANIDKIKQMLTEYELVTEEWGGDTIMVPISAKFGEGIDKLLESILLLADVNDYKANPSRRAKGSVIEAKLDKGKGPVANIIVQNGTLHVGDTVISGTTLGRIRAMTDDKGRNIKEAGPSTPVSILGFTDVPAAGDPLMVVQDEKMAKQVVAERIAKIKNEQVAPVQKTTLDDVFNKIVEGQIKDLNIIIKADVQGSVEALKNSLSKLCNEEAKVNVISGSVGAINKSDIMLAEVSKAIIIGFNVRPDAESKSLAEKSGIEIRNYKVIFEVINDVESILSGMIAPKTRENITGKAEVRNVFKITGSGVIAGSYVLSGKIYRNSKARVFRGEDMIFDGQLDGLKRFKDDVKEVAENYECGISVSDFSDFKEGDIIEAYLVEVIK